MKFVQECSQQLYHNSQKMKKDKMSMTKCPCSQIFTTIAIKKRIADTCHNMDEFHKNHVK